MRTKRFHPVVPFERPQTSVDLRKAILPVHTAAMTDWKRKLAAYLHGSPSKAVSVADRQQRAQTLYRQAVICQPGSSKL